jgi:hypothetical protein
MQDGEKQEIDPDFQASLQRLAREEQAAKRRQAALAKAAEVYFLAREKGSEEYAAQELAKHLGAEVQQNLRETTDAQSNEESTRPANQR